MTEERRSHERFAIRLPVKWESISGRHETWLEDISLGGCFVNTRIRADIGELITLEIQQKGGDWIAFHGEVISFQQGIGFGVVFTLLTEEQESVLEQVIAENY